MPTPPTSPVATLSDMELSDRETEFLNLSNQRLLAFKDKHKGERCVIIGNGPSLNQMDLSFLKHEICFGTNKIFLGFKQWDFLPTYYVAVNRLVIKQNAAQICQIPCPKFISNRGIPDLEPQEDLMFIRTHPDNGQPFCPDPTQGLQEGNTVTYVAMQLAYYMGFETVILIGVDHDYKTPGIPHTEVVSEAKDPNHFHPDYFGDGVKWHLPDLAGSERFYKIAYAYFWVNGRQILDATVGGNVLFFRRLIIENCFYSWDKS